MASRAARSLVVLAGCAAAAGLLAWALRWAQAPPEGPVLVAWDQTPCSRCRMLVGDPAFASQLHTPEGVLHFDDPGCLLLYVHERRPVVDATWFHHHAEDRWIRGEDVRFVPLEGSPMGYGLGATDAEAAPLSRAAALARARAREAERKAG